MPPKPGTKPLKKLTKGMGLYQVMYMPDKAPDKSKPWAVVNLQTGDINGRWHPSKEEARKQQIAMYSSMGRKARYGMSEPHSVLSQLEFAETTDKLLWLEALPAWTWHTTEFGEVDVTMETLQNMVDNFYGKVRGIDIATDFNHGRDAAKGEKASGWIREAEIRDNSLWLGVEPTPTAKQEIADGEWKYFSLQWDDVLDNKTGEVHKDVILGGGFTNRPIAKGMVPINFSELFEVKPREFASKKPYGNVAYADPGYQADGKARYPLDTETHIRAAWSYINQAGNAKAYTASQLSTIKARIKAAMRRIGANVKQMSEENIEKELNATTMTDEEATKVVEETTAEHAAQEHSEPGEPDNFDPTLNEDDSFPDRRHTDPQYNDKDPERKTSASKEDSVDKETDAKLRQILGLAEDADIVKAVNDLNEEVGPLRDVAKTFAEKKKFAEQFPKEAKELEEMRKERIEGKAKQFAEELGSKRVAGDKGLSAKSIERVANLHKAFSEGSATIDEFQEVLETIAGEDGLVDFSEKGSTRDDELKFAETGGNGRMKFAEAVKAIAESDKLDMNAAIKVASERYPELAASYATSITSK